MNQIEKLQKQLQAMLPEDFYQHSLRVQARCIELAQLYGVDTSRAGIAGLLHDVGRKFGPDELIYMAETEDLPITEMTLSEPVASLHGPIGARLIEREFGIGDREVLGAVAQHALGGEEMSLLSKILFLADKTEQELAPAGMAEVRRMSENDLDAALVAAFDLVIRQQLDEHSLIVEQLVRSRNKAVMKLRRAD